MEPSAPDILPSNVPPSQRRCVACGYNLFGLGEEPRCPECGLLNVPEGYRRQVWELVDSGRWFFSGFFSPFKKRPPGWWWSLDRPGDVKRAWRRAGLTIALCWVIGSVAASALACVRFETKVTYVSLTQREMPNKEGVGLFARVKLTNTMGLCGVWGYVIDDSQEFEAPIRTQKFSYNPSPANLAFRAPDRPLLATATLLALLPITLWLVPAGLGIWTQIRRGLPKFAQAPETIFAASFYESHRMVYLMLLLVGTLSLEMALRFQILVRNPMSPWAGLRTEFAHIVFLAAFGAAGWVGPLRSDYTKQLIRSSWHAVRIIAMYVVFTPLVFYIVLFLWVQRR
jgi:hypothetical protein